MARYFLTKSTVEPGSLLEVAGTPVLARYDALVQSIQGVVDPASIGVLAEPMLSQGNDVAPATVVWYSSYPGEARKLADLDPERREALLSTMRARLVEIAKGLSDPSFGPLVGAALNVLDADDVHVVDGQPVLVGWGMVPPEANVSTAARNRHFAQSMARHLPLAEAPPVTPEEWQSRRPSAPAPDPEAPAVEPARRRLFARASAAGTPAVAGAPAAGGAAPAAATVAAGAATAAGAGGGGDAGPPPASTPPERRGGGWRWIPLVLLLLVSIAALVWLLTPGTRLMPPEPAAAFIEDEEALRIAREGNAALEERARQLEEAIAGAMCTPDGELVLPDGRTREGVLPGAVGGGEEGEPVVGDGRPDALVPPAPDRVEVPDESRAGEPEVAVENPATLLDLIESRTALVLMIGQESSTGTGFFVASDLLVTNDHVVAGVDRGGEVFVVNKHLGEVRAAEVLSRLGPLEDAGGDYALLRVSGADSPFYTLRDSTETMRLQNVIAAGYPGVILETDVNFARLREGDPAAIPELAVTEGIVNVEQNLSPTTRAIIHTARISGGNSGGPLVDGCGRVVGINTFVRSEDQTNRSLNFSLASTDLLRFLDGTDVRPARSAGPCTPRVRAAKPPPRTEEEPADGPETETEEEPAEGPEAETEEAAPAATETE